MDAEAKVVVDEPVGVLDDPKNVLDEGIGDVAVILGSIGVLDPVTGMMRVDVVKSDSETAVGKSEVTSGVYVAGKKTVVFGSEMGVLPFRIVKCGLLFRASPKTETDYQPLLS